MTTTIARVTGEGPLNVFGIKVPGWYADSLCAQTDPETFFPEKGSSTREAKRTCLGCGVREKCLQKALDDQEAFGVWGGLSANERRKLLRQRRSPGATA